ncbi:MAG TPA: hypothetical protein PKM88_08045 [bacterium]|nr:hypothetical protein [bacterium]
MNRLLHFLGYWLWLGFAGGAGILLFIAAPLAARLTELDVSRGNRELALTGLALGWVMVSATLAWLIERMLQVRSPFARGAAHAAGLILCLAVFAAFLQTGSGAFRMFRGSSESWGERFTFGPYPQAADCLRLKREGYTGIITLMNALVPFEAVLLSTERESARAAAIELIEIPMLPWVTDNRTALDQLRALAQSGEGRYYVHCYLGRHRAELARSAVLSALGETAAAAAPPELPEQFERGRVRRIDGRFILGPLPTTDEWFEFVLRAQVQHVVCLLNPADAEAQTAVEATRTAAQNFGITLHFREAGTDEQARATAAFCRSLAGTVYVHAYATDKKVERVAAALAGPRPDKP